jgi:sarcosine oxidase, subunit gamma
MASTTNIAPAGTPQFGAAQSSTGQAAAGVAITVGTQPGVAASASHLTAFRRPPQITASALVRTLPAASRYILRGNPHVMTAAGAALGLTISQAACRAATNEAQGVATLWLGPDEQLLIASETGDLAATLQPALHDLPHSLVEVSHRQIALEVSGPHATAVLNAGCPLDLDLSAFPVGMCTRTVLTKAEIVLWRTDETVFHVEVWRSFASYVTELLAEIAREVALLTPTLETNS